MSARQPEAPAVPLRVPAAHTHTQVRVCVCVWEWRVCACVCVWFYSVSSFLTLSKKVLDTEGICVRTVSL